MCLHSEVREFKRNMKSVRTKKGKLRAPTRVVPMDKTIARVVERHGKHHGDVSTMLLAVVSAQSEWRLEKTARKTRS